MFISKLKLMTTIYFLRWYHRGGVVASSNGGGGGGGGGGETWLAGGTLVMGAGAATEGEYTCVANNSVGETRFSTHVRLQTPLKVTVRMT